MKRVKQQGGVKLPWKIDLKRGIAKLETIEVDFFKLPNGLFNPGSFRRTDQKPEWVRDRPIFEDAVFAIHQALSKEGSN